MHETRIKPDLRKLSQYFPDASEEKVHHILNNGVKLRLNYSDAENPFIAREEYQMDLDCIPKEKFNNLINNFEKVMEDHKLVDYYDDLLLLVLLANENLAHDYDFYYERYEDNSKAKEVASFLLAYKKAVDENKFQLVIREKVGRTIESVAINDSEISKWMCQAIYEAVQSGSFPFGLLGESIYSHLGISFHGGSEISLNNLKRTSQLTTKAPKIYLKKLMVQLCLEIRPYLDKYTHLQTPKDGILSTEQGKLFYDILQALNYIDDKKIESLPQDYIYALFQNYTKVTITG